MTSNNANSKSKKQRKPRVVNNAIVDLEEIPTEPGINYANWAPFAKPKLKEREIKLMHKRKLLCESIITPHMATSASNVHTQSAVDVDVETIQQRLNRLETQCNEEMKRELCHWNGASFASEKRQHFRSFIQYFSPWKNAFDQYKLKILYQRFYLPLIQHMKELADKHESFSFESALRALFVAKMAVPNSRARHLIQAGIHVIFAEEKVWFLQDIMHQIEGVTSGTKIRQYIVEHLSSISQPPTNSENPPNSPSSNQPEIGNASASGAGTANNNIQTPHVEKKLDVAPDPQSMPPGPLPPTSNALLTEMESHQSRNIATTNMNYMMDQHRYHSDGHNTNTNTNTNTHPNLSASATTSYHGEFASGQSRMHSNNAFSDHWEHDRDEPAMMRMRIPSASSIAFDQEYNHERPVQYNNNSNYNCNAYPFMDHCNDNGSGIHVCHSKHCCNDCVRHCNDWRHCGAMDAYAYSPYHTQSQSARQTRYSPY